MEVCISTMTWKSGYVFSFGNGSWFYRFGRKNIDAIGDTNLKSFTVAYSLSYFHHKTENRIDLWKIYDEQCINEELLKLLKAKFLFFK